MHAYLPMAYRTDRTSDSDTVIFVCHRQRAQHMLYSWLSAKNVLWILLISTISSGS
jgi:hypothetical protein